MRRLALLATLAATAVVAPLPAARPRPGSISSLSVDPLQVRDGATSQGPSRSRSPTRRPRPLLFSGDPSVATVPASWSSPPGATTATFPIATNAAAPATIVQITAAIGNVPRTANLSVNAARRPARRCRGVGDRRSDVAGGGAATGTVTFTGATDGADVQLARATRRSSTCRPTPSSTSGQSSGAFPVTTRR